MLTDEQVADAAFALYQAELDDTLITPISERYPDADVDDAYRIALAVTALKVGRRHRQGPQDRAHVQGDALADGATEPDYGTLFDDWFVPEGGAVPRSRMNDPLVEVEIAFVLGGRSPGPASTPSTSSVPPTSSCRASRSSTRASTGRGPNRLVDSIADAAACGRVVLGGCPARLTDIDVRRIGASLSINGTIEQSGVAAAVMGNPINAVAWLANKLHEFGVVPEAGHVVLSGSFVKAVPFAAGDTVVALFDRLGEVTFVAE